MAENKVLFNPELMDMVLNFLDFKEVKNARLVCQQWNKFGWEILRQKMVITFFRETSVRSYINDFKNQEKPGFHYRFCYERNDEELIKEFFLTFGPGIHSLHLDHSKIELDINSQKTLTNLEVLSVNCNRIELPVHSGLILKGKNPTLEIYEAESLKDFKWLRKYLGDFIQQNSSGLKNLGLSVPISWKAEAIQMIMNSGIKQLDSLELWHELDDRCLSILKGGELKFKKLFITLPKHTPSLLADMLNSQNELEDLRLHTYCISNCVRISLASFQNNLQKLRTLILSNHEGNLSVFGKTNFPMLESLELSDFVFDGRHIDPISEDVQSQTLKSCTLRIYYRCRVDFEALFEHLSNVFPSLSELYILGRKVMETHLNVAREAIPNLRKCTLVVDDDDEMSTYKITFKFESNPYKVTCFV